MKRREYFFCTKKTKQQLNSTICLLWFSIAPFCRISTGHKQHTLLCVSCSTYVYEPWQCNLLCSQWDGHKPPGFHPKYLQLCSEDERTFCVSTTCGLSDIMLKFLFLGGVSLLNMVWKSTERFGNLCLEKYGILKWIMCRNPVNINIRTNFMTNSYKLLSKGPCTFPWYFIYFFARIVLLFSLIKHFDINCWLSY